MFGVFNRESRSAPSRVREWAARQKEKDRSAPPLTICSHSIIWSIATFCDPSTHIRREKSPLHRAGNNVVRTYCGDATLFELGCFVYFRIDLWCHQNGRDRVRDELLPRFMEDFVRVFQELGGIRNARELFDQRIDFYGSLVRDDKVGSAVTFLETLILLTENNKMPQIFEGETPAIVIGDIFELAPLKIIINGFVEHMIPPVIRNCERIEQMLGRNPGS